MLSAIPGFDGDTYDFDRFYRRSFLQISEAGGKHITFFRIGDPEFSDPLHKERRTPALVREDRRQSREWEKKYSSPDAEERQRIAESLKCCDMFNVKEKERPCFVFIWRRDRRVGLLRVPDHWYASESSWRVFRLCLCSWLKQKSVVTLATADLEDAVLSRRLSRLLGNLSRTIEKQLQSRGVAESGSAEKQSQADIYCRIITEKGEQDLTYAQYERFLDRKRKLDMFINGMTGEAMRRDLQGQEHLSELKPRELNMLLAFITSRRPMRPCDTTPRGREKPSWQTANHTFGAAMRKVDTRISRYKHRFFCLLRDPEGSEFRKYYFNPAPNLKYLIMLSP